MFFFFSNNTSTSFYLKTNSEGECMSMFIFLPDDSSIDGWFRLIVNLRQLNLNRLSNSTEEEIEIFLPKFRIETEVSLNDFFRSVSIVFLVSH